MKNAIKAVCFDFYGVISLSPPGRILTLVAQLLRIPIADFKTKYFTLNYLSNVENQSFEDVVIQAAASFNMSNASQEEARNLIRTRDASQTLNTELLTWFPLLKKQGLKVGILSNATTAVKKQWQKEGLYDLVDAALISAEIGYQKPDKEAFEALFEDLGVLSQETIFIDDSEKSLEKAAEIGYHPILFTDNEQLKKELQNFGINL